MGGGLKFTIIGGAGAMGRITVRDLLEFGHQSDVILIADYDLEKACSLVREWGDKRLQAVKVDVRNARETARACAGSFAIVNCVQYQWNLDVMKAALLVKAHYIDLGGLFHVTKKQLVYDAAFR